MTMNKDNNVVVIPLLTMATNYNDYNIVIHCYKIVMNVATSSLQYGDCHCTLK